MRKLQILCSAINGYDPHYPGARDDGYYDIPTNEQEKLRYLEDVVHNLIYIGNEYTRNEDRDAFSAEMSKDDYEKCMAFLDWNCWGADNLRHAWDQLSNANMTGDEYRKYLKDMTKD